MPSKKIEHLEDLFFAKLSELYYIEKEMAKSLPKLSKKAWNEDLKEALEIHLEETNLQIERIEEVFKSFDETAKAKKNKAMMGLLEDSKETMELKDNDLVRDAAIVADAQATEHLEIALYGTVIDWARVLEYHDIADLLEESLEEELLTDEALSELANAAINADALAEEEDEDDA